jgi:hypothetical protein
MRKKITTNNTLFFYALRTHDFTSMEQRMPTMKKTYRKLNEGGKIIIKGTK